MGEGSGHDDEIEIVTEHREVRVARARAISMIQVMPNDLDALEEAQGEAAQSLAFSTAALGILAGAVLGWASGWATFGVVLHSIFFCTTAGSFVAMLWFGLVWRRRTRRRSKVLERIRSAVRPSSRALPT